MTSEAGRAIGEMLKHNTTVTSLFLLGGRLGDSGARGIAIGLAQNTTIAQLSIAHSSIGTAGIKAITKVIQNVTRLNLSSNPVGYDGVKAIARLLVKSCSRLKFLFLDHCNIDVFGAKELAIALSRNSCLEELSVACNDINDEGMCALAESVASNETLQVLYISYNNVGQNGKKVIISACETSKSVRHLYHENDSILNTFTKPHSVCLVTLNKTVRTLGIRSHNMTSEASRAIGEMLRRNTTVTSLFLLGGRLGDSGARGIAIGLAQNKTIADLSLVRSSIGTAGIKAITNVIQNVTRLNLSSNPVGYDGVKAIARLLVKSCCRLKFLFLDHCNIDVFGAKELAIALSRDSCLEELSVACNDINDEGMCALAESVASNETLQVLYISYNNVGQNGKKVIISACETSKSV
ncbi:predicted protein, partial [Nematostella vectensis]